MSLYKSTYVVNSQRLYLIADRSSLCYCFWESALELNNSFAKKLAKALSSSEYQESRVIRQAKRELNEYIKKERSDFSVPLSFSGSDFELSVLKQLLSIPYAKTVSYSDIAKGIGRDKSQRAVGRAVGANPLVIFIPCHRVICSDGSIHGYSGGDESKRYLLTLEQGIAAV